MAKNNLLENWDHIISIVAGIATAISLVWAAFTYYDNAQLQKEITADGIYQEHMKLSIEHLDFANGKMAPEPPSKDTGEQARRYEQYRWYVGHALFSFESIFQALPGDTSWEITAKAFIAGHSAYLGSKDFQSSRYSPIIQQLILDTLGKALPY